MGCFSFATGPFFFGFEVFVELIGDKGAGQPFLFEEEFRFSAGWVDGMLSGIFLVPAMGERGCMDDFDFKLLPTEVCDKVLDFVSEATEGDEGLDACCGRGALGVDLTLSEELILLLLVEETEVDGIDRAERERLRASLLSDIVILSG